MTVGKSLRSNFGWNLASNAIYGLYQWVIVAVIAKVSGPSSVGEYSLALAVVVPIQMFFNMQLRAIQASDAADEFWLGDYIRWRYLTTLLSSLGGSAIALSGLFAKQVSIVIGGLILVKAVESIADVVYGAFQRAERMDISSQARIGESCAAVLLFTVVLSVTGEMIWALISIGVGLAIVLCLFTLPNLSKLGIPWTALVPGLMDRSIALRILRLSLPLGITMALISGNAALPRLALGQFRSEFDVGIYAGLIQLILTGTMIVGAAGQAATPRLSKYAVSKDFIAFNSLLNRLILGAFALGIIGAFMAGTIGPTILKLLYTETYGAYSTELVILALSASFTFAASFQGYALTALRVIKRQVSMGAIVGVVTLIALVVLVPTWGLFGACLAVLAGSMTQYGLSFRLVRVATRGTG